MTDRIQWAMTPRDRQLEVAKKELVNFEKRENAFRMKDRVERAVELRLPLEEIKIQ